MNMRNTKRVLTALLLTALLMLTIVPTAFAEEEAASAPMNSVEAATVDELLKAIAPNTVITLTGRSYDFTRAQGYGVYGGKYYRIGEGHKEFIVNKAMDEDFYMLTLMGLRASPPATPTAPASAPARY